MKIKKANIVRAVLAETATYLRNLGVEEALLIKMQVDVAKSVLSKRLNYDMEKVIKRNEEGDIIEMFCPILKIFLPANDTYFYRATDDIGFANTGLRRASRAGDSARKKFVNQNKNDELAVLRLLNSKKITLEEAQTRVKAINKRQFNPAEAIRKLNEDV